MPSTVAILAQAAIVSRKGWSELYTRAEHRVRREPDQLNAFAFALALWLSNGTALWSVQSVPKPLTQQQDLPKQP